MSDLILALVGKLSAGECRPVASSARLCGEAICAWIDDRSGSHDGKECLRGGRDAEISILGEARLVTGNVDCIDPRNTIADVDVESGPHNDRVANLRIVVIVFGCCRSIVERRRAEGPWLLNGSEVETTAAID